MHHAHPRARIDALTGRSSPPNGHVMCNILLLIGYVAWHPRHTDRRRHARRSCRTRLHDEVRPSLLAEPRASQCPVHSHCASALGLARAGCIHSAGVLQLQHSWTSSARPAASTWGGSAWTLQLARGRRGPGPAQTQSIARGRVQAACGRRRGRAADLGGAQPSQRSTSWLGRAPTFPRVS